MAAGGWQEGKQGGIRQRIQAFSYLRSIRSPRDVLYNTLAIILYCVLKIFLSW